MKLLSNFPLLLILLPYLTQPINCFKMQINRIKSNEVTLTVYFIRKNLEFGIILSVLSLPNSIPRLLLFFHSKHTCLFGSSDCTQRTRTHMYKNITTSKLLAVVIGTYAYKIMITNIHVQ